MPPEALIFDLDSTLAEAAGLACLVALSRRTRREDFDEAEAVVCGFDEAVGHPLLLGLGRA